MGIDKGNAAEQSIAKELYILNKKLDRLIDILDKRDVVLKIDNGGITMEPEWHAAADRYVSYIDNGPGEKEES